MGQKVNPHAVRIGITRDWDSNWYANKGSYSTNLLEDFNIRKYLKEKLFRAGVSKILISRRAKQLVVDIFTARPGMVIGKGGQEADQLKAELQDYLGKPVHLNINEEKNVETNAQLWAEAVSLQLEKRIPFRRAMKQAVTRALKAGALGIKVRCSGRLAGAEIARAEWYREGRVPLQTFRADIDHGFSEALTTYGKIGVQVWIYKGDILGKKDIVIEEKKDEVATSEEKVEVGLGI
jgi:small subunit ribosomal protein S3